MSALLPDQTTKDRALSARTAQALSPIGYQAIPAPTRDDPFPCPGCGDSGHCGYCFGLGWNPRVEGFQTCPVCEGWRVCPCQAVEVSPGNT